MQNATILGGVGGLSLTPDEAAFFREADPWGFILFGRNVDAPDQLRRLTAQLREAVGRDRHQGPLGLGREQRLLGGAHGRCVEGGAHLSPPR